MGSRFSLYFDHPAGQFPVFNGGNAPDDFHAFDEIGRQHTHIDAFARAVPVVVVVALTGSQHVLHVGIRVDGHAIDKKSGS